MRDMIKAVARFAALPLGAVLIGGCSGGRRVDTLKGLSVSSPVSGLSVVLVNSENTKNSMAYMGAWRAGAGGYDNKKIFKDLPAILGRHFKSVASAESVEAAQALKPDLIGLIDAYAHHQGFGVGFAELDMKVVFLTPERREVETLHGRRTAKIGVSGLTPAGPWVWGSAIRNMQEQLGDDIEAALSSSVKLAEFAHPRAAGAAAPEPTWTSDVDHPAYGEKQNPNNFAVVVGIEKYSGIPEARFAERDAAAVKEHLIALGFPERNIRFLAGPQASRASLAKELETWLPRVVDESSTVLFYYSGHGAPDIKSGQAYLLPWDGDAHFLQDTAYPIGRLYEKLNALKAKRIVVALDSCFSGAGGRSVLPKGARPLVTKIDTATNSAGKLLVLTASAADEISGSDEVQGHGVFTYYLLRGLSGAAADKAGRVSVQALYDYLVPKVRDAAARENRDQTPQLLSASADDAALKLR